MRMTSLLVMASLSLAACGSKDEPKAPPATGTSATGGSGTGTSATGTAKVDRSTPEATVRSLIAAAAAKDRDALAQLFASDAEGEFSVFTNRTADAKQLDEFADLFRGAKVLDAETSGGSSRVRVDLAGDRDETIDVVKEGATWKVHGF